MKQVKLLKLELFNYRNIEHAVYMFDGENAKIVGENRIGKTNTLEAIYFLLSNYLLDGSSKLYNIKNLNDTKKPVRVKGTFKVDDREIELTKLYAENWVKTRGSNDYAMSGHIEEYYVNGIKQTKEKDYFNVLDEYFGVRNDEKGVVDKIQMLSNPLYLGNLGESKNWTTLREFIVKLIGDVSNDEIFEKEPSTLIIKQDLINSLDKVDQVKKLYKDQIESLNLQINAFDSQIELLEKTEKPSEQEVENAKAKVEETTNQINEIKMSIGVDSVANQIESEIFNLSKEIVSKNEKEFKEFTEQSSKSEEHEIDEKIDAMNKEIDKLIVKKDELDSKERQLDTQIKTQKSEVEYCEAIRTRLANRYKETKDKMGDVDNKIESVCPTCHRPLEQEQVDEAKKHYLDALNLELNEIVSDGKNNTNRMNEYKESIEKAQGLIAPIKDEIESINKQLGNKRDELNKLKIERNSLTRPIFQESDELVGLRGKLAKLKDDLANRKALVSQNSTNYYAKITTLEYAKKDAQKVLDDDMYYQRQMKVLESVELEKGNVSSVLIKAEQKKEALNTFIYTKLKLLDEHIAKVFGKIKFQLIKENINGGFDPVCKPYIYDVDKDESTNVLWDSGSKSEKVITGIAIVEAIKKELDYTNLPYLFDEGGEISNETLRSKFKTNAQIICVRVEDNVMTPTIVKF